MSRFLKKFLAVFTAVSLMMLGGCNTSQEGQQEKSLYDHGLEVVSLMQEMASSEEYLSMMSGSAEIMSALSEAGQGDFSSPKAVYQIKIPGANIFQIAEVSLDGFSPSLQKSLEDKANAAVLTQINSMGGVQVLAASSVCTAGKTFVSKELKGNMVYLYTFENAVPAAVSFTKGEDDTVSASGMLLLYDGFEESLQDTLGVFLEELGGQMEEITK